MKYNRFAVLAGAIAPRAVQFGRVRADANDPKALVAQLQAAFVEFRAENDKQLDARFKDVVTAEKIDKINAALSDMQAAVDAQARQIAAGQMAGEPARVKDAEYTGAFNAFMRNGETAAHNGAQVQASLKKSVDAEGGFLAPVEWDRTITDKLIEISPMREICAVQPMGVGSFKKLVNLRGTASGWVDEDDARAETATPQFGTYTYNSGELYANPAASQQMLEDAEFDLEQWLAGEIDAEFAYQEGVAFLSGDGSKKPTGVLTYVTGAANAAAHPLGDIKLANSGNAALLTADGMIALVHKLPTAYAQGASMIANRNTIEAIRKLKDTTNQYLWQPSFQAGTPATLLGYGLREVAGMPDVAANAVPVLFGDFKRGYVILDRVGTSVLRDPFSNKPFVQFYTRKRVGGGVLNPEALKGLKIAV